MTGVVRRLRGALLVLAGAAVASAAIALASELDTDNVRETSRSDGTPIEGLRPTGVGLLLIGAEGTIAARELADHLSEYHDSGAYDADVEAVGSRARTFLRRKVRRVRRAAARRCDRARADGRSGDASKRACRKPRLALVLDIDETSVSNYECLATTGFLDAVAANAACIAANTEPPIGPTLRIYRTAIKKGVGVFFITGRPESIPMAREQTELNLRTAGYEEWEELILAPELDVDTIEYKSGERARIERKGWRIILNLGDQESDLEGGHAKRAFKLPNPFYFIGR